MVTRTEFQEKLETEDLSPVTIKNYVGAFTRWQSYLAGEPPTQKKLESWLRLKKSKGSKRKLKGMNNNHQMNRFMLRKLITLYPEEYEGIQVPKKRGRNSDPEPKPFTGSQTERLLERMPSRFHDLMWLLSVTGMRISEALNLRYHDIDEDEQSITFFGKGRKEQTKYPSPELIQALIARHPNGRRTKNGRLIDAYVFRHPQDDKRPLYPQIFWYHLDKSMKGAHAHRYRHSYATDLVSEDINLKVVQKLMGHRSIQSTERYVGVSTEQLRAAAKKKW